MKYLIPAAILSLALPLQADVPPEQQAEVQHLLDYLGSSDCKMIRNGKEHDNDEAVEHVERKYDYYRDDISSTEEFIEYSATKSMLSGKEYSVDCPGSGETPSGEWLNAELQRYRGSKAD